MLDLFNILKIKIYLNCFEQVVSHSFGGAMAPVLKKIIAFFFFLKVFGGHMSFFLGHWYPCFGFLVTSPLGFKARVGCLICIAEANVMYVPRDPPLVLHLPTSWRFARSRSCPHILFASRGEVAGIIA